MKLRYTPAAICDLEEIEGYIRDVLMNPEAALGVVENIVDSCAKLKEQPYLGVELRKKLNRDIEGRFLICNQYVVIYDVGKVVSVLRVLDTRTVYLRIIFAALETE